MANSIMYLPQHLSVCGVGGGVRRWGRDYCRLPVEYPEHYCRQPSLSIGSDSVPGSPESSFKTSLSGIFTRLYPVCGRSLGPIRLSLLAPFSTVGVCGGVGEVAGDLAPTYIYS